MSRAIRSAFRRIRGDSGQGMTEYIIVVALVAIAAIGVTSVFGEDVRSLFGASTQAMAGSTTVNSQAKSGNSTTYVGPKNLSTFAKNNAAQ
jgi:Flp pilus assembly pilin Flp